MELSIVLKFLKDLAKNNNKEWFLQNQDKYKFARQVAEDFVEHIINEISLFDNQIPPMDAKKCFYRMNRDARFLEPGEGPYKENMGAFISKGGKQGDYAGYYIHIEPGACFLGGGLYSPEAPILHAVRDEIEYNFKDFSSIVTNKKFVQLFDKIEGKSLVNVPKKYPADSPAGEYLKMKSYTVWHDVDDKTFCSKSFPHDATAVFKTMSSFNRFLNYAIDNKNE